MSVADPFVLAVAGPGSNSGKTELAVRIIRRFEPTLRVGAMKISTATPDFRCARTGLPCRCLDFEGPSRLREDDADIRRTGKDTERLWNAGARPVWWLQTTADHAVTATRGTLDRFPPVDLLVVEGAGPIRADRADLAILFGYGDTRPAKAGWEELVPRADHVLLGAPRLADVDLATALPGLRPEAHVWATGADAPEPEEAFWDAVEDALRSRVGTRPSR